MHDDDLPVSEQLQHATVWKWVALTAALVAAVAAANDLLWTAVAAATVVTCAVVGWAVVFVRYHLARFRQQADRRSDAGPHD